MKGSPLDWKSALGSWILKKLKVATDLEKMCEKM